MTLGHRDFFAGSTATALAYVQLARELQLFGRVECCAVQAVATPDALSNRNAKPWEFMHDSSLAANQTSTIGHNHASQRPREEVDRLMYASRSLVTGSVFAEMQKIRAHALQRNMADSVHVALLHQSGWFMEWIEGPSHGVRALMSRVVADPRHQDLHLLHRSSGPRRLSEPWSMALVQTKEAGDDFSIRVTTLRDELRQGRKVDPASVWRRLSTPLTHPGASEQARSDRFQRVMVCAAQGADSFNLVHHLGTVHQAEVVHRRFVGAHADALDVATDYVDLEVGAVVRRVVAMARNGLQIGLTRAFLTDYSHVILLLCGVPARDQGLIERLVSACAHLQHRPVLVGLGPLECDHVSLQRLAHAGGLVYLDCDLAGDIDSETLWAAAEPALDLALAANYNWLSQQSPHWSPALRSMRAAALRQCGLAGNAELSSAGNRSKS